MPLAFVARERHAAECVSCDDGWFLVHSPGQPPVRSPTP
jgi:hypothetical protein